MKFERNKDPKKTLEIGLLQACKDLVKERETRINILDEAETYDLLIFEGNKIWKFYPHPHSAADFIKTNAITKSAGCHICIGTMNGRYLVVKNTGHIRPKAAKGLFEIDSSGTLEDLYKLLTSYLESSSKPVI